MYPLFRVKSLAHPTLWKPNTPPETLIETLSILSILISRFPSNLSSATFSPPPLTVLAPLLAHQRPVIRKRAIITLAQFIPTSQPELYDQLLKSYVYPYLTASASLEKQRTTSQLVAAVARHSAIQIAPVLGDIVPGILDAVQRDDEELRESGLQVNFISFFSKISECTNMMDSRPWKHSCFVAQLRSHLSSVQSYKLEISLLNTIRFVFINICYCLYPDPPIHRIMLVVMQMTTKRWRTPTAMMTMTMLSSTSKPDAF